MSSIETAIRVLRDEADAILSLIDKLDNNFELAVDLILHANGRVILTGMESLGILQKKFLQLWQVREHRHFFFILRKVSMEIWEW